jgi:hypothetical protein
MQWAIADEAELTQSNAGDGCAYRDAQHNGANADGATESNSSFRTPSDANDEEDALFDAAHPGRRRRELLIMYRADSFRD